jgi:hypothetical protein
MTIGALGFGARDFYQSYGAIRLGSLEGVKGQSTSSHRNCFIIRTVVETRRDAWCLSLIQ